MPAHYVVAIDQGTQSTRCFVYDNQAKSVACSQQAFEQIHPQKGCDLDFGTGCSAPLA
jgi:glycerol kinase